MRPIVFIMILLAAIALVACSSVNKSTESELSLIVYTEKTIDDID